MKNILLLFLLLPVLAFCQEKEIFPNYKTINFDFQGHQAKVVIPNKKNEAGNWIWRARFWGHEPQTDKALLEKGFHVVYVDVAHLFGNQEAIERWNAFYDYCRKTYQLSPKVVLEGMSRGGLIIYNWAAQNTEKVACIYADAPVCDIKSWPGGQFTGTGSPKNWEVCLKVFKLTEGTVKDFKGIPIYTCEAVAKARIPVLHVYGGADEVVPPSENTELLAKRFESVGGTIKLIRKENVGHHPHSLKNPQPIVDFILTNTLISTK